MAAHDPWFKQFATTREDARSRYVKMARALGVREAEVVGCVTLLKCWALEHRPDGVFDELDAVDVEIHAKWEGTPGAFTAAALAVGVLEQCRHSVGLNQAEWLQKEAGSYKIAQRRASVRTQCRPSVDTPSAETEHVSTQARHSVADVSTPESRDKRSENRDPDPNHHIATTPPAPKAAVAVPPQSDGTAIGGGGGKWATKKQFDAELADGIVLAASHKAYKAFQRVAPSVDELRAAANEVRADAKRDGPEYWAQITDRGSFVLGIVERMRKDQGRPRRVNGRGYHPGSEHHEVGDVRLG